MERIRTNPLQRLHDLLRNCIGNPNDSSSDFFNQGSQESFGARLLRGSSSPRLSPEDAVHTVYRAFAKFLILLDECEHCAKTAGDGVEGCQDCLVMIREVMSGAAIHGSWPFVENNSGFRKQDMLLLRLSAKEINNSWKEEVIEEAELISLIETLTDLRQRSGEADISPKLKAILLQEIARLIDALQDYRFIGASGIKSAAAAAFGSAVVEREEFYANREKPEVMEFWNITSKVADLAAVALLSQQFGLSTAEVLKHLLQ